MILVDTSVWVDYFNGNKEDEKVKKLVECLKKGLDVFLTDLILTEILQGIKDENKYTVVKNSLVTLKFVHAKNFETYIHACDIYRNCRKRGITVRKTIDCVIAAIAIENKLSLLSKDNDFLNIAKCEKLDLV